MTRRYWRRAALAGSLVVAVTGVLPASAQSPGGHLVVWDWQYTSEKWGAALKQIDEAFMAQNPGVTIEHVGQPNDTYYQLIQAANAAQSGFRGGNGRGARVADCRRVVALIAIS